MVRKRCTQAQNFEDIRSEVNFLDNFVFHEICKTPEYYRCDLMITITRMKDHAALIVASLDEYCAAVETREGFRIICENPKVLAPRITEALEEAGWSNTEVIRGSPIETIRNNIHQYIEA